jgi:RNA methyltransferase, TrmH family
MTITSPHNPHLKHLRRLARRRERERAGRFTAEGEDLIVAAEHAGWPSVEGYRVAGSELGGARFTDVAPEALAAVSALGSGTRAIGVYEQRWLDAPEGPLCVYLHGVRDPGNVGTVLRSAAAFGASCVALGPDCADPYSPKAVRASMGAVFAVALARVMDTGELPGERIALVAGAGEPLSALATRLAGARASGVPVLPEGASAAGTPAPGPPPPASSGVVTLLVGAEREGLPAEVVDACEHVAHIPIAAESLNAAMAATVALYETTRASTRVPAS